MQNPHKKAVVLLSGGLDSTTLLYLARSLGYACHCLIFDYGQRHKKEVRCAQYIARKTRSNFTILKISFPWKGSSLLNRSFKLPVYQARKETAQLPSTYVPGRNTIFISFALSLAETIGAHAIFIGANAIDYSGYPDCRPRYFAQWQKLITSLGLHIRIVTPLIRLNKSQIVRLGSRLKVPFEKTWSCYRGGPVPCGVCDSCGFRRKGFLRSRLVDPLEQL